MWVRHVLLFALAGSLVHVPDSFSKMFASACVAVCAARHVADVGWTRAVTGLCLAFAVAYSRVVVVCTECTWAVPLVVAAWHAWPRHSRFVTVGILCCWMLPHVALLCVVAWVATRNVICQCGCCGHGTTQCGCCIHNTTSMDSLVGCRDGDSKYVMRDGYTFFVTRIGVYRYTACVVDKRKLYVQGVRIPRIPGADETRVLVTDADGVRVIRD